MSEGLKRGARALLELIYPIRAECMGCGTRAGFERDWLCEDCRQALSNRWVGAAPPPEGGLIDGAAYAYLYGGPAGGLVRNLKYRGVSRLAEPMGRQMLRAFDGLQPAQIDCVVPVPMHIRRTRKRGVNQALLLAREMAGGLGLPLAEALVRTRNTRQQARLDAAERLHNLDGAFAVACDVKGKRVLLVDDVCTTGATANACAEALLAGGASAVLLVCFCLARKY
ncbi:MAG: ComF family protein [Clostridia bacterium]|nr:ComF family protein [Clostridia bacterium]